MKLIPKVIGLTGLKRAGKGTVANALAPEFSVVTFASPLKKMLKAIGLTDAEMEEKEVALSRFGRSPRYMMQTLGTEWGRNLVSDTIWLDLARAAAKAHLRAGGHVVFDDIRFDNEAQLVHELDGEVWHVIRPSFEPTDRHISEQGVSKELITSTLFNTSDTRALAQKARLRAGLSALLL